MNGNHSAEFIDPREIVREHNIAVVALAPGYMRPEAILDGFGVAEENWRDAIKQNPRFESSETPFLVGRGVVALATDPDVMQKSERNIEILKLAKEYGFSDVDGRHGE